MSRRAGPLGEWVILLIFVLGVGVAVIPSTAHAAADSITELSVDFDIQPDGSVAVRYELDWQFGTSGRHGIDFGIATRESWDADTSKDVVYGISDISVTSPSGAPATFTREDENSGSVGRIALRIGDPNRTVEDRRATYVISYVVTGALRTFDGRPEFFWDVTSQDYPEIDSFTVRVTAPQGVTDSLCFVGEVECATSLSDATAVYSGGDVAQGDVVSVVAAMPPGSVNNAEPVLEDRGVSSPTVIQAVSVVDVLPDGMIHVDQQLTYTFPRDHGRHDVTWELPTRRPFSADEDQVFRISNVVVEGGAHELPEDSRYPDAEPGNENMRVVVTPEPGDTVVLRLSYDVEGAVITEGNTSGTGWILAPTDLGNATWLDFTWNLPGESQDVRCSTFGRTRRDPGECGSGLAFSNHGDTVSWSPESDIRTDTRDFWVVVDVPASSVGHAGPLLEPGLGAEARKGTLVTVGGSIVAFIAVVALGAVLGQARFRPDKRWSGVAPGLTNWAGGDVRATRRGETVPVRLEPPDCSLVMAGLVMDRRALPQHTAAVLVGMATEGAVEVQSKPLVVKRVTDEHITDYLQSQLYWEATTQATPITKKHLRAMNLAVGKEQGTLLGNASYFTPARGGRMVTMLLFFVLVWVAFVLGILNPSRWWALANPSRPLASLTVSLLSPVAAVFVGAMMGAFLGWRRPAPRSLEPGGTAMRDQVHGFRQYIAKAEANQLDFEANHDIYRRYLPWAVLFGLTQRWTQVCQQLVDAGSLPPLDTSFWVGQAPASSIAGAMPSLSGGLRSAGTPSSTPSTFFSGGGSAGSSGFSSGSSSGGGGGGGGTSASSW